jgi:hypothetical protein
MALSIPNQGARVAPLKVRRFYPSTITVDDPESTTREINIRVTRFDNDTFGVFEKNWRRVGDPPSNRMTQVRNTAGDEQEKKENGEFVIPLSAVMERRLAEMSTEERAKYDALDVQDEAFAQKFLVDSITAHVRVPEGEMVDEDEEGNEVPVTTGAQLLKIYGGRGDVLRQLLTAIWTENTMSAAEKKVRRSLYALSRSLNEQAMVAVGLKQVPTADAAVSAASVEIEDATQSAQVIPFGSAETPNAL